MSVAVIFSDVLRMKRGFKENSKKPAGLKSGVILYRRSPAHTERQSSHKKLSQSLKRRVKPLSLKAAASFGKIWIRRPACKKDKLQLVNPPHQAVRKNNNSLLLHTCPSRISPSSSMRGNRDVMYFFSYPSLATVDKRHPQRQTLTFGESGRLIEPIISQSSPQPIKITAPY